MRAIVICDNCKRPTPIYFGVLMSRPEVKRNVTLSEGCFVGFCKTVDHSFKGKYHEETRTKQ